MPRAQLACSGLTRAAANELVLQATHAPPSSSGPGAIDVGTTAYSRFLFRDPLANDGGRNASNALAATFAP